MAAGESNALFKREPAAIVAFVEAAVALLLASGLLGDISAERIALIMAVVTALGGVLTALATDQPLLGGVIGLTKAVLALGAGYGLATTDAQAAALIALITAAFGLAQRSQASPTPSLSFSPN